MQFKPPPPLPSVSSPPMVYETDVTRMPEQILAYYDHGTQSNGRLRVQAYYHQQGEIVVVHSGGRHRWVWSTGCKQWLQVSLRGV